jgi:hypothetical protein
MKIAVRAQTYERLKRAAINGGDSWPIPTTTTGDDGRAMFWVDIDADVILLLAGRRQLGDTLDDAITRLLDAEEDAF